jgi:hypothetical protein
VRRDRVSEVLAVVIEANDPTAMADRWAQLLDAPAVDDTVALDAGGEIRFVAAGGRGEGVGGFVLRAASPEHIGTTTICNCRFDLV